MLTITYRKYTMVSRNVILRADFPQENVMTRHLKDILNPFRHGKKSEGLEKLKKKIKITIFKTDRNLRNSQSKELNMICIPTLVRPYFLDNYNIR